MLHTDNVKDYRAILPPLPDGYRWKIRNVWYYGLRREPTLFIMKNSLLPWGTSVLRTRIMNIDRLDNLAHLMCWNLSRRIEAKETRRRTHTIGKALSRETW